MESLWARTKAADPFVLSALHDDASPRCEDYLSEDGLFKNIDFAIPELEALHAPTALQEDNFETLNRNALVQLDELPALQPLESRENFTQDNVVTLPGLVKETERQQNAKPTEPFDDIWQLSKDLPSIKDDIKYLTWQNFHNPTHHDVSPNLLSEADPSIFDAALHAYGSESYRRLKPGRAVQADILLQSLLQLGLGRSSVLFPYNPDRSTFTQALHDARASGTTFSTSQSLIDDIIELGNAQVQLRQHVQKTYSSKSTQAGAVALAKAVLTVQDALEVHLVERMNAVRSLVQLQVLFGQPKRLIVFLKDLVDLARTVKGEEAIISVVYDKLQQMEMANNVAHIAREIMRLVSRPWLDKLQDLIGLSDTSFGTMNWKPTVHRTASEGGDSDAGTKHDFPSFVEQQESVKIIETSEALQYLKENEPSHGLVAARKTDMLQLEWGFGWQDIDRISAKASAYHDSLLRALRGTDNDSIKDKTSSASNIFTTHEALSNDAWLSLDDPDQFFASIQALDTLPMHSTQPASSNLHQAVIDALCRPDHQEHDALQPTLSLSFHLSLKPLLAIQHQQLTTAALDSIMHQHSLRTHLSLLHAFHLSSSGIFTTRLASALFDPDAELAERKKNTIRSGGTNMGLKLGSGERREWPPASSELRLALMNVLTDCWRTSNHNINHTTTSLSTITQISVPAPTAPQTQTFTTPTTAATHLLPGDLSFALRTDLSATEIDRILDADSLYALDFLHLHYTPPPALRAVFTPSTLNIYDRVFRLLLRLLRVNFVLEQLFRDTVMVDRGQQKHQHKKKNRPKEDNTKNAIQTFRHRATFVVHTVTSQFIFAGIARPWKRLMGYLDRVDTFLLDGKVDVHSEQNTKITFAGLVQEHADALDSIASALLVKKRQGKAAVALEAVLGDALEFAVMVREGMRDDEAGIRIKRGYERFDEHVSEFSTACGELLHKSGRHGHAGVEAGQRDAEECILELVERLEGNL